LTHAPVKQNPKRTGVSMIKKKKKLKENAAERPKKQCYNAYNRKM
jgi:hypothetical protein